MLNNSINKRPLSPTELNLVLNLLAFCKYPYHLELPIEQTLVFDLTDDGGMGSFEFVREHIHDRQYAKPLIQAETYDTDGRKIMLEISIDEQGYLYQMDSWVADFNPLVSPLGTVTVLENIQVKD
ncbi:hypothetical protein B0181_06105 [Moraxella caviae]|uniref:DUF6984 domain-containing protein n=2 Tax=Moraxella caviae TaxID=34060 RepID=A0A1T0A258_9GAMM|nr:hypothetical protein [Moraxella caviae]OOR89777.1 hypothetical protein B0181_06105 [Moraxella caviae]STZ10720.1 Uncharacterised protein [Moraxella caviae]VEW11832.1 Uncharacterised protein [Moraxella caviae]